MAKKQPAVEEEEVLDGFAPEETGLLPLVQFFHHEGVFEICLDGLDPDVAANLPTKVIINGQTQSTEVRDVMHSGGKVPMFRSTALHMAIVALRDPVYYRKLDESAGGGTEYAPAGMKDPIANGYRSRLRGLALVRELCEAAGHPLLAVFTLKSSSVGDFNNVYRKAYSTFHTAARRLLAQHYYQLAQAATQAGDAAKAARYQAASQMARALPRSAFYIPFVAGNGRKTKQGGIQAPIGHALPNDVTLGHVKSLLIPAEARRFLQNPTVQAEIRAFVTEREREGGSGYTSEEEEEDAEDPRAARHANDGNNGLLRVRVTLSRQGDVPMEYAGLLGKSFGQIVAHPDGLNFLAWLTNEYQPRCEGDRKIVEAAHRIGN